MNYYPHHIGDFRSGTVNMSRQSRWIYRDMLDVYYDSESPLPLDMDVLCAEIGVESDDERKIVERLLRFKFIATAEGYRHGRCDIEIANYHAKADIAKANGKLGGRPRKANQNPEKPSGFQSGSDPVPIRNPIATGSQANQEPITNNQKPLVKRATRIAPNFDPEPEPEAESGIDRQKELANFRDYWSSKARDNTKLDWQATWRQWARKADRSTVNRFAKPDPFITVPGRTSPDPELIRLEMESKNASPMPDHIREHIKRIKGQA